MKTWKHLTGTVVLTALLASSVALGQHDHIVQNESDVKWGDAPPFLPPGAKFAKVYGNPMEKEQYAVRMKLPAGYKVPAHSHPGDEHLVVLSGALYMGLGDKIDTEKGMPVKAGGIAMVPAKKTHFAYTKEETTFIVYGVGPIEFIYANPADDPRKKDK
jgi:quercetin dioxygenase-like cupin family protein